MKPISVALIVFSFLFNGAFISRALIYSTLLSGVFFFNSVLANADKTYEKQRPPRELTSKQAQRASDNYQKYCSLCHGKDREGHANDHAPSLRSKSLMESGVPHAILRPLNYGRENTAMAGYLDEVGGPLTLDEAWDLTYWLFWESGAQRIKLSEDPVHGDVQRGEQVFQQHCASCHGKSGEGVNAPALGNQSALAHNKDEFIRYAIEEGRQGTPMQAFKHVLSDDDIDNVTAFIRSKASGWTHEKMPLRPVPTPDQYVRNPQNKNPEFELKDDQFISSEQLYAAIQEKRKMVILDTRVPSVWQRAHIEGSIPFPYYTNLNDKVKDLPKDAQIVAYCSCPRAASVYLVDQLNDMGFDNTAVLYEGIFGWMNKGFPVTRSE